MPPTPAAGAPHSCAQARYSECALSTRLLMAAQHQAGTPWRPHPTSPGVTSHPEGSRARDEGPHDALLAFYSLDFPEIGELLSPPQAHRQEQGQSEGSQASLRAPGAGESSGVCWAL